MIGFGHETRSSERGLVPVRQMTFGAEVNLDLVKLLRSDGLSINKISDGDQLDPGAGRGLCEYIVQSAEQRRRPAAVNQIQQVLNQQKFKKSVHNNSGFCDSQRLCRRLYSQRLCRRLSNLSKHSFFFCVVKNALKLFSRTSGQTRSGHFPNVQS